MLNNKKILSEVNYSWISIQLILPLLFSTLFLFFPTNLNRVNSSQIAHLITFSNKTTVHFKANHHHEISNKRFLIEKIEDSDEDNKIDDPKTNKNSSQFNVNIIGNQKSLFSLLFINYSILYILFQQLKIPSILF